MNESGNEPLSKADWRAQLLAARAEMSPEVRASEARALAAHVAELDGVDDGSTVCGYAPFGSEPGSLAMLDALRSRGARVLLPVIPSERGPLDWAEYGGADTLTSGRMRGVLEPRGARLGPSALAAASVVLVPALAVDDVGVRLGRGAGFYDRSLRLVGAGAALLAVVRDAELVHRLPAEPHDVPMTGALAPGGVVALPRL